MLKWILSTLYLLSFGSANAEGLAAQIGQVISPKVEAGQFDGVVLVADKDGVLYRQAFGYADLLSKEKMTAEHRFNIGSIGKEFSAAAIALLVRGGKLRYDDKLSQFVAGLPQWANKISVAHLLTYSSGLPSTPEDAAFDASLTNKIVFGWLNDIKSLAAKPGENYLYSLYSPFLLAQVVERVSGKPFDTFVHDALLKPAGMKNTELEINMSEGTRLRSKAFDADGKRDFFPLSFTHPSAYTNVDDMYSWAQSLSAGRILKRNELETLSTPQAMILMDGFTHQQTSFGNIKYEHGKMVAICHQGSHLHFNSVFFVDLKSGVTIIVLTNHTADGVLDEVFDGIQMMAMKHISVD